MWYLLIMRRLIRSNLQDWYSSPHRKPLVLKGARQVGKTFAVNEFGRTVVEGQNGGRYHYFDLKKERDLHSIFQETQDIKKILEFIELKKQTKITAGRDLIFLDEIQDCSQAISSLKYFEQDLAELHVIAAGSHLGLVKNEESFPVGKVNFLSMFPMTFYEFLVALKEPLCPYLDGFDPKSPQPLPAFIHQQLLQYLFYYFAVGGLPEAVLRFKEHHTSSLPDALKLARQIQNELLTGYEADFSKYSGTVNANHIHSVFRSISKQLAKSFDEPTSKFKFSGVIPNQKGFDRIIGPLTWLTSSRLCIKSYIASRSGHPLQAYTTDNVFKVFYLDVGLLNAALDTPMESIVEDHLESYKGYIVENFVCQELYSKLDRDLVSWQEGQAEVEFLINQGAEIIPIEVKSGTKSRRAKSLDAYIAKYHPKVAYKLSAQNVGVQEGRFITLPLYLCSHIF